jgi:anti-sigma B factor antagonist
MHVTLSGELDVADAPTVQEQLQEAIAANPGHQVDVDVAEVSFLDSTIIGVFIRAHRHAAAAGGALKAHGANRNVRRVIELTSLTHLLADDTRPDEG